MRNARLWTIGAAIVLAAAGVVAYFALNGRDDTSATTGPAGAEQSLREQQLARQRRRIRALERKRDRLEREIATKSRRGAGGGESGANRSFSALAKRLSGSIGVAYGPPGTDHDATVLGDWSTGPAWSTIKVPVSVASVRDAGGHPSANTSALMRRAVTASDNAAAESLWSALGAPAAAGRKVEAVLAAAGDSSTSVQTRKVRAEFSSFGQTIWSLAEQQRFAAALPCLRGSDAVLALMGQVIGGQRWGLGQTAANQRFKGGWGPDRGGAYDVRQFGLIELASGGTLAVALAAHPSDGSFETGKTMLNALADWVAEHGRGGSAGC